MANDRGETVYLMSEDEAAGLLPVEWTYSEVGATPAGIWFRSPFYAEGEVQ